LRHVDRFPQFVDQSLTVAFSTELRTHKKLLQLNATWAYNGKRPADSFIVWSRKFTAVQGPSTVLPKAPRVNAMLLVWKRRRETVVHVHPPALFPNSLKHFVWNIAKPMVAPARAPRIDELEFFLPIVVTDYADHMATRRSITVEWEGDTARWSSEPAFRDFEARKDGASVCQHPPAFCNRPYALIAAYAALFGEYIDSEGLDQWRPRRCCGDGPCVLWDVAPSVIDPHRSDRPDAGLRTSRVCAFQLSRTHERVENAQSEAVHLNRVYDN